MAGPQTDQVSVADAKAKFRAAAAECSVAKLVVGHLGPAVLGAGILGLFSSKAQKMPGVVMNAIRIAVELFTPKQPPDEACEGDDDEELDEADFPPA